MSCWFFADYLSGERAVGKTAFARAYCDEFRFLQAMGEAFRHQQKNTSDNAQGRNGQNNLAADALKPSVIPARQDAHTGLCASHGREDREREDPPDQVAGNVDQ